MKILIALSPLIFLVGFNLILTVLLTFAKEDPWCKNSIRRNWRFPPPPQLGGPIGGPPAFGFRPFGGPNRGPNFQRPYPAHLPGRPHVVLYQHENHNGLKYEQVVGRCHNLPNVINDKASSVDTNNRCVMVCRDKDCKKCKKMRNGSPGHFKLSEIGMDDSITSIKPCGEIYK